MQRHNQTSKPAEARKQARPILPLYNNQRSQSQIFKGGQQVLSEPALFCLPMVVRLHLIGLAKVAIEIAFTGIKKGFWSGVASNL